MHIYIYICIYNIYTCIYTNIRFRAMAPMYYRGASAALLVYDVTSPASFEDIQGWVTGKKIYI